MYQKTFFLDITTDSESKFKENIMMLWKKAKYIKRNILAEQCQSLLNENFYYAQIIYPASYKLENDWPNDKEYTTNADPEWHELSIDSTVENSPVLQNVESIPKCIHCLADQLPRLGSFSLQIFCNGFLFDKESPNDHVLLYGALLRMSMWHNGNIVISETGENRKSTNKKWAKILKCQIELPNLALSNIILWRGGIRLGISFMPNCPIVENLVLSFPTNLIEDDENDNNAINSDNQVSIVSPNMQLLHICDVTSLSPFFIHSSKFIISSSFPASVSAKEFFNYMKNNQKLGIVARLHYEPELCSEQNKDVNSEAWNKAITKGDVDEKFAQSTLSSDVSYINFFLFCNEKCQENTVFGIVLRHPQEIDPNFFKKLLIETETAIDENIMSKVSEALELIPNLSENNCEIECIMGIEKMCLQPTTNIVKEIDPSDWVERRFLLSDKLKKEKTISLNGLKSPKNKKHVLAIKANELSNYFKSNGESKAFSKISQELIECGVKPNISKEGLIKSLWPQVKDCSFHDVYYNTGDAEFVETERMKLLEKCLMFETNTWQTDEKCFYVSEIKNQTSLKKSSSPPSKKRKYDELELRRSPRHHQTALNRKFSDKNISLKKAKNNDNIVHLQSEVLKKAKIEEKLNITQNSTKKNATDLDEKNKKKLREAVVTALESEGITMENPIFKRCGPRLFNVCKTFVKDVAGKGVSSLMKHVAEAHVKQVIEFEKLKKACK